MIQETIDVLTNDLHKNLVCLDSSITCLKKILNEENKIEAEENGDGEEMEEYEKEDMPF